MKLENPIQGGKHIIKNIKVMKQKPQDWEEEFEKFWWEIGEYSGRELGIAEYKKFISELLEKQKRDTYYLGTTAEAIREIKSELKEKIKEWAEENKTYRGAAEEVIRLDDLLKFIDKN